MSDLWIVRHGPTEWSRAGRHTSTTDLPLLADGEDDARALAPRLADLMADLRPALVLTSPRVRARRTAELAGFPDAVVDDDLVEWDYGDYEGLTTAQIRESVPGWTVFSAPCPGGESAAQVGARLDRVVARARAVPADPEDGGGPVLAFAHGHCLRVLAARWLGLDVDAGRHFVLGTATVSTLGEEHGAPAVVRWNA